MANIVDFGTELWGDPWFQTLGPKQKLLFIYLWTNPHKNLPCLYPITLVTMRNETELTIEEIKKILPTLAPKVMYDEPTQIVWVRNFVKRQFMRGKAVSANIVIGIQKALSLLPSGHPLVGEFLTLYKHLHVDFAYKKEGVYVPLIDSSGGGGGEGKVIKYKKEVKEIIEDFNLIMGTMYLPTTTAINKLIKARLKEGHVVDDFKAVHRTMHIEWKDNPEMAPYLRPQTLYNGKFSGYLNRVSVKGKGQFSGKVLRGHDAVQSFLEEGQ